MKKQIRQKGFTLIEVLIVIGIIAILAAVVLVAINPARQFASARNSQRLSNVNAILNAIGQNMVDNKGTFTCGGLGLPAASTSIDNGVGSGQNFSCLTPTYLAALPADPSAASSVATGYYISVDPNGRVLICAPDAGLETALPGSPICVKR